MQQLIIEGIPGLDGTYDTDYAFFTMREYKVIKDIAKVRAGELSEALAAGDTDLIVALAVIGLRRRNIDVNVEVLWDSLGGKIRVVDVPDEVADARPPETPSRPPEPPGNVSELQPRSGPLSEPSGDETQVTSLPSTGTQA